MICFHYLHVSFHYLDSDFALTLGYLNSALNNRALFSLSHLNPFLLMSLFEDTLAWMRT